MQKLLFLIVFGAIMMAASPCWANEFQTGIPHMINYQGMLTDDAGIPLNDSYDLTFSIYRDSTGGSAIWTETHTGVLVQDGLFNAVLGSGVLIPDSVFEWSVAYLGIKIGTQDELSPRTRFTSVGYAYRARWAERSDTSDYALSSPSGPGDYTWTFRISDGNDTTISTGGSWGIARYGTTLYGNADSTHVNLGVACTTGTSGLDKKYCTVGGGRENTASGDYSTTGGGFFNTASATAATVGGGFYNTVTRVYATVGGGYANTASGLYATVPGGFMDSTAGAYSFAAGREVKITSSGDYTFAFGNNFSTSASHAVIFHDSSTPIKVGIGITQPGVSLDVGDMARIQGLNYPTFPTTGKGLELAYKPSNNTGLIQVYDRDSSSWGKLYLGNGEVGVGTSDPGVKLQVSGGTDIDDNTENTGYLIVGSATGSHLGFDNNEIMAKGSGTSVGDLYIQNEGGSTNFGGDVNIDGKINGAVGVVAMGCYYYGTLYDNLSVDSVSWSSTDKWYDIYLTGIFYDYRNYVTIVTPVSHTKAYIVTTSALLTDGHLRVYFWNILGNKQQCDHFHFVVYNKE
jgi:hypothetical protein